MLDGIFKEMGQLNRDWFQVRIEIFSMRKTCQAEEGKAVGKISDRAQGTLRVYAAQAAVGGIGRQDLAVRCRPHSAKTKSNMAAAGAAGSKFKTFLNSPVRPSILSSMAVLIKAGR